MWQKYSSARVQHAINSDKKHWIKMPIVDTKNAVDSEVFLMILFRKKI